MDPLYLWNFIFLLWLKHKELGEMPLNTLLVVVCDTCNGLTSHPGGPLPFPSLFPEIASRLIVTLYYNKQLGT